MNRATESPVRITVSSRTSTNLNSRPADADPKISTASAGMKPACVIRMPNTTSERDSRSTPEATVNRDLFAAAQSHDHDVDAEQDEDPAEHGREVAGSHPHRAAERVIPGDEDRQRRRSRSTSCRPRNLCCCVTRFSSNTPSGGRALAACANFPVTRGYPKRGFARAKHVLSEAEGMPRTPSPEV